MSDINLMKTDNLLFSERPVSIGYQSLKAEKIGLNLKVCTEPKTLKNFKISHIVPIFWS